MCATPGRSALVFAADAPYFELVSGLVDSYRTLPDAPPLDLCMLDLGLEAEQAAHLASRSVNIRPAGWDLDFPARDQCPPWFRAMVARPHLPKYFPGYDTLLWIDADCWLVNAEALRLLIRASADGRMAIVPELDRAYDVTFHRRAGVHEYTRDYYEQCFGPELAEQYSRLPVLNSGAFALKSDSPSWRIWADLLSQALQRCANPLIEQAALNVGIVSGKIPAHFLPSWCNWKCIEAIPMLNPQARTLHSPLLPHEAISICHLIHFKTSAVKVPGTDGRARLMPLTYQAVRIDPIPAGSTNL